MSRRAGIAAAILLLCLAGLAALARHELFRGEPERIARAAPFVAPGTEYYAVNDGDKQIGYASSTIDTSVATIDVKDIVVADLQAGDAVHRLAARSQVQLTRGMRLTRFLFELGGDVGPFRATGEVSGDSLLTLVIRAGDTRPDTQRVRLSRPLLVPTVVPLALALGQRPTVGKSYAFSVLDPVAGTPRDVSVTVKAESLFVVSDSATPSERERRWISAHADTVRAWRIQQQGDVEGGLLSGWIDEKGRLVEASPLGRFTMRRSAYELAFQNWSAGAKERPRALNDRDDIQETTALSASVPLRGLRTMSSLRVRLRNMNLAGFDLHGARQQLTHDTLEVDREDPRQLSAGYLLPADRARFAAELAAEPLVQAQHPEIVALARRIAGGARDPREVAERLNRWVHDSLEKKVTLTLPNALQVLHARRGDCNEHTQLYLALARAVGLPARGAAGLTYLYGKFYYHAWPEVYLGRWVAVDPTLGQFPADASHLRFVLGGYAKQAELLRLIGTLQLDVLSSN